MYTYMALWYSNDDGSREYIVFEDPDDYAAAPDVWLNEYEEDGVECDKQKLVEMPFPLGQGFKYIRE